MFENLRQEYRQSLKSSDTEEHIDLAFYRPVGFVWAILCRRLGITPNAVTIVSIFLGVGAGICFYYTDLWLNVLGIFLLIWANSLDSADGQLARLTKQYSRIGRILDGMAGDMWFISIYVCICLRATRTVPFFIEHHSAVWLLAVGAGICHALQAAVADYFRQFHLMFTRKDFPTELENSTKIRTQIEDTPRSRFFKRLVLRVYYAYTRIQERMTPATQTLLLRILAKYPDGNVPGGISSRIRMATLPMCKWENFLTFNWRAITLFICVLLGVPYVYFIVELTVFNIVLVYLMVRHEHICRRIDIQEKTPQY